MVAVLLVDVDRIKMINDSLGHDAGDEILVAVGHVLEEATGLPTRLPGSPARSSVCAARTFATRARHWPWPSVWPTGPRRRCPSPVTTCTSPATIGVALSRGNGDTPESLVRDADVALSRATEKDRGRVELFDEASGLRAVHRLEVENGLRAALQHGELRLHYQPIVRLADGAVTGAEALVRWQHPTRGLLSPDEFIPIAEETGLIKSIGEWVIQQACNDVSEWRQVAGFCDVAVAVNVSARQLNDDDITRAVRDALAANSLPAAALTLEITETALMGDEEQAKATVGQLHELGVRLAIDDFGTGYSAEQPAEVPLRHPEDRPFVRRRSGGRRNRGRRHHRGRRGVGPLVGHHRHRRRRRHARAGPQARRPRL